MCDGKCDTVGVSQKNCCAVAAEDLLPGLVLQRASQMEDEIGSASTLEIRNGLNLAAAVACDWD